MKIIAILIVYLANLVTQVIDYTLKVAAILATVYGIKEILSL